MAREKSPAFQFYPKEFITDSNVAGMSLQERGAYITLLCYCWQDGTLPNHPKRLAQMVGLPPRAFSRIWPALSVCFREREGLLIHPRLEKEREKQAAFSRRQSDAAASRWDKPDASREHPRAMPDACSPISDLRTPVKEPANSVRSITPVSEMPDEERRRKAFR